ncbi:hypothetical protein [Tepidibacillus marianensis]|uniref:hypothetical protein n=1 Tax=Tepidibacillus marianensis TaxID=3131995 RepID=UPI0030D3BAF7
MKKRLEKWKTKKRLTMIILIAVVLLSGGGFSYYYLAAKEKVDTVSYQTSKAKKGSSRLPWIAQE